MARRQEGRRRRGGTERGRGKDHRLWHTCQPRRVGRGDCWGPSRLSPTDCILPPNMSAKVRVDSGLGPLPAQSKGEGPRSPAHPAAPDNLVSKQTVQPGWRICCSRHRQETGPHADPQDDKSGRRRAWPRPYGELEANTAPGGGKTRVSLCESLPKIPSLNQDK